MSLDTLAQLGEFVGGVFVIISLAYLAHQVRQNTRSLKAENYARVLERMSTLQSRLSTDAELNRLFMIGAQDPARLSRSERLRFTWALYELLGAGEFMYHQWREQALPPEVWARWEAGIVWWLSYPGIRAWWGAKPAPLAADFEAFGNEILESRRMDPAVVARWEGFIPGEGLVPSPPAGGHAGVARAVPVGARPRVGG